MTATDPGQSCFVLEAKIGPNDWAGVDQVYPLFPQGGRFDHEEAALMAKSRLKTLLAGKWKAQYRKYPIRVREMIRTPGEDEVLGRLSRAIENLDCREARVWMRMALDSGQEVFQIFQNGVFPALEQMGKGGRGKGCFLPEIQACTRVLGEITDMVDGQRGQLPWCGIPVVVGVVKGDIHDVGKNHLRDMLQATGFWVKDLGRDVSLLDFSWVAAELNAGLICLSTHQTTTLETMAEAARDLGRQGYPVMVGGGAVTRKMALEMGARDYAPNAALAVIKAGELLKLRIPVSACDEAAVS